MVSGETIVARRASGAGRTRLASGTRGTFRTGCSRRAGRTSRTSRTFRALWALRTLRARNTILEEIGLRGTARYEDAQHVAGVNLRDAESRNVAGFFGIESIRDTQKLLGAFDAIGNTTIRIDFRLQVERTIGPVDAGHRTGNGGAVTHLKGKQTVCIGGGKMSLYIHRCAVYAALQDGNPGGDALVGHKGVVGVANHCLITHLLGCLSEQGRHGEHHD